MRSQGYRLWVASKQLSRNPQTSYQCLLHQPRGPAGCPARRAWRTGHRCRTCSAGSEKTWMGCCIYHEAAISCLGLMRTGRWWDVLSEFGVSMFPSMAVHTLAMPYLVDRLDVSAVPVCITTTSAFPHGSRLHVERRPWQGCGVVQSGK